MIPKMPVPDVIPGGHFREKIMRKQGAPEHRSGAFSCAPGMGIDLEVEVLS